MEVEHVVYPCSVLSSPYNPYTDWTECRLGHYEMTSKDAVEFSVVITQQ